MEQYLGFLGAILLLVSGAIVWWRKKRVFDRTNQYGVERFPSFAAKSGAKLKEGVASFAALVLGAAGVLLLAVEFQDSWGWIVLLPVLAWMLFLLLGA